MCSKLKIDKAWYSSGVFIVDFDHSEHISIMVLLLTLSKCLSIGCERQVIMFWKHKKRYICFVIKVARSISFSDLSLHRIEINHEQMTILWTYYDHNMNICNSCKLAPGIATFLGLLYHRYLLFAVSNRKPIYIIETVKEIGRYLIHYGNALKRRPCWKGQTRLIPSVFYMLPFQAFPKQKR